MNKKDMEMAFPWADPNTGNGECGMTLRDYFAGKALAGMLSNHALMSHIIEPGIDGAGLNKLTAAKSYLLADAMLAERNNGEG